MRPEVLKSWSLEIDYSRAPCLGADQKARGLWERDSLLFEMDFPRVVRFPVPLDKGNDCSGDEIVITRKIMPSRDAQCNTQE